MALDKFPLNSVYSGTCVLPCLSKLSTSQFCLLKLLRVLQIIPTTIFCLLLLWKFQITCT